MHLSNLTTDSDAVSPVIGVILMVAITVILAAVIGTFVLGLGDQVSDTSPQAQFSFDFDEDASALGSDSDLFQTADDTSSGDLTITHDGGDSITDSQLTATDDDGGEVTASNLFGDTGSDVSAGSSTTIDTGADDTVRIVWASANGGDTATVGKWTGPDA